MKITLELLPHEIGTVRTLVKEITTALGVALANVHDDYSSSVVIAELPKTSHSTTAPKHGDSIKQDDQSPSIPLPLSAEAATVDAGSNDQTKRRYSRRPSDITRYALLAMA